MITLFFQGLLKPHDDVSTPLFSEIVTEFQQEKPLDKIESIDEIRIILQRWIYICAAHILSFTTSQARSVGPKLKLILA